MNTKLTLSLDKEIVAQAKDFARQKHTSLSKMFEEYLRVVTAPNTKKTKYESSPIDELMGIVNDPSLDYDQVRYEALKKKYGL